MIRDRRKALSADDAATAEADSTESFLEVECDNGLRGHVLLGGVVKAEKLRHSSRAELGMSGYCGWRNRVDSQSPLWRSPLGPEVQTAERRIEDVGHGHSRSIGGCQWPRELQAARRD